MIALGALLLFQSIPEPVKFRVYVGSQVPSRAALRYVGGGSGLDNDKDVVLHDLKGVTLVCDARDLAFESLKLRTRTWRDVQGALEKDNSVDLKKLKPEAAEIIARTFATNMGVQGLKRDNGRVYLGCGFTISLGPNYNRTIDLPADIEPQIADESLSNGPADLSSPENQGPMLSGKFFVSRFYEFGSQRIKPKERREAVAEAVRTYEEFVDNLRAESATAMANLAEEICKRSGFSELLEKCGKDLDLGQLKGKQRERLLGFLIANRSSLGLGEESDIEKMLSKSGSFRLQPDISFMSFTSKGGSMVSVPFIMPGSSGA